ncbi:hypothetical protein [Clostridium zeae]
MNIEKVSVNVNIVDLGKIDLLIKKGYIIIGRVF